MAQCTHIIGCVLLLYCSVNLQAQTDTIPTTTANSNKLKLSGFMEAEGGLFRSTGDPGRMPGERFRFNAQPRLRYGDWDIPMSVQLGNYEDRLLQPFNKFGMSPRYKWITAHLGHRQLSFSPFTYHQQLIFGVGLELNPGKFRFAVLHGELNRSTTGGPTALSGKYTPPNFRRTGTTGRIGVGSSENFVDLIVLHGRDQSDRSTALTDSLGVYPEENVVVGVHTEQRIAKYFFLTASAAASAYTLDTRSPETETDDFFLREELFNLFRPRISSRYLGAYMGQLAYRRGEWQAEASYTYIQPEFKSMGIYFTQSDLRRFGGGIRGSLLDRRLSFRVGYRNERNNLMNQRSSENARNFLNTRFSWKHNLAWTATLGVSIFSMEQRSVNPDQALNLSMFNQLTSQFNGNFTRRRPDGRQWWSLNASFINRRDRLTGNSAYTYYSGRGSYFIPLDQIKRWSLEPELGLTHFSITESFESTRIASGLRLAYRHRKSGLDAYLKTTPVRELNSTLSDAFVWRNSLNTSYRFKKNHRISMRLDHSSRTGNYYYAEFRGTLTYRYSFL